ncbi:MAG: hypothetical protein HW391_1575 [Chloroflexi bacterium]|nr:hypothetical protein [Chloroflexota bacterium]
MTVADRLRATLDAAALELPDTTAEALEDGGTAWSRAGTRFTVVRAGVAEFRLDQAIAYAAARTPDAAPSGRGPEWIAFSPPDLDGHALDRLVAWFAAAHRRATPG